MRTCSTTFGVSRTTDAPRAKGLQIADEIQEPDMRRQVEADRREQIESIGEKEITFGEVPLGQLPSTMDVRVLRRKYPLLLG